MTKENDNSEKDSLRIPLPLGQIILICVCCLIIGALLHDLSSDIGEPIENNDRLYGQARTTLRIIDCNLGCFEFGLMLLEEHETNSLDCMYIDEIMFNCTSYCGARFNDD